MVYKQTNIVDFTHLKNRDDLIPKIGLSYVHLPELKAIVDLLNNWQYETALNHLDDLIVRRIHSVDALLLKGEVLALFEENQKAIAAFEAVLTLDSKNIYAATGLCIQLERTNAEESRRNRTKQLVKELAPAVFNQFVQTLDFMDAHKNRFNRSCEAEHLDLICVYGYFLNKDGTLPLKLQSRLDKVKELASLYPAAHIAVSGGAVQNEYSEAEEIKKALVSSGINKENITAYDRARDTVGNVIEFLQHIKLHDSRSICVVSSKEHLPRAWMSLYLGLKEEGHEAELHGEAPVDRVPPEIIKTEHHLNYQTLFRVAGLFEKRDIRRFLSASR